MAVSNLDPNSMIVLDHELGQVITFAFVVDLGQHNDDQHDTRVYHLDICGMEHVFDDVESMLTDYGLKANQCSWMLGQYVKCSLPKIISNA